MLFRSGTKKSVRAMIWLISEPVSVPVWKATWVMMIPEHAIARSPSREGRKGVLGWAVVDVDAVPDGAAVPEDDVVAAPVVALDDIADGTDDPLPEVLADADAERILTLLGAVMGAPVDQNHRGGRVPGRSF